MYGRKEPTSAADCVAFLRRRSAWQVGKSARLAPVVDPFAALRRTSSSGNDTQSHHNGLNSPMLLDRFKHLISRLGSTASLGVLNVHHGLAVVHQQAYSVGTGSTPTEEA